MDTFPCSPIIYLIANNTLRLPFCCVAAINTIGLVSQAAITKCSSIKKAQHKKLYKRIKEKQMKTEQTTTKILNTI